MASFALPAWAVRAAQIFSEYAPASWVIAGFGGLIIWAIARLLWQLANRLRIRNLWDIRNLERGSLINPLDLTFERKRIRLDEFALPSHTVIEGKTFIDCDIIGPANIYFHASNLANPIRVPKVDAVWLAPKAIFTNGFTFRDCIFRNCSFQRITLFGSIENYKNWKDNPMINWIGITPTAADLAERQHIVGLELGRVQASTPDLIEHKSQSAGKPPTDPTSESSERIDN